MPICPSACRLAPNNEFGGTTDRFDILEYQLTDPRKIRAAANPFDDTVERFSLALQQELNSPVGQVAHVPAQVFGLGVALNEVTKADPLYPAGNKSFKTANWRHADNR